VDKLKDQCISSNYDKLTKHSRAKYIICCGLNANEYNQIHTCDIARFGVNLLSPTKGQVKLEKKIKHVRASVQIAQGAFE